MKKHKTTVREKRGSLTCRALRKRIRERAYELYELRGKHHGHEIDDWLKAESEVTGGAHPRMTGA